MPAELQIRDPDKDRAQDRSSQALTIAGVEDLPETSFVCAGDVINIDQQDGFLRGHGTQVVNGQLVATLCGVVLRVDKLVSVRPVKSRYTSEVGDVVVGRVLEIAAKRWRIDMNARREAALMLSAVNLPGGVQRRRTAEDELNMRAVYEEGDLISAEVQSLNADGSVILHTRSTKYGKLESGQLIDVPANIVKRQKQHFHSIEALGVDMIIGCNGMIWVTQHAALNALPEGVDTRPPIHLSAQDHASIARVANAVRCLALLRLTISPVSIQAACQAALDSGVPTKAMMLSPFLDVILAQEVDRRLSAMGQ